VLRRGIEPHRSRIGGLLLLAARPHRSLHGRTGRVRPDTPVTKAKSAWWAAPNYRAEGSARIGTMPASARNGEAIPPAVLIARASRARVIAT